MHEKTDVMQSQFTCKARTIFLNLQNEKMKDMPVTRSRKSHQTFNN